MSIYTTGGKGKMGNANKAKTFSLTWKHIWGYGLGDAGACMTCKKLKFVKDFYV